MIPRLLTMAAEGPGIAPMRSDRSASLASGWARVSIGLLAFFMPWLVALALAVFFGLFALGSGIRALLAARRLKADPMRSLFASYGAVGAVLGALTLLRPRTTVVAFISLVAIWAIVRGWRELLAAARARRLIAGASALGLRGAATALAGLVVVVRPSVGVEAFGLIVGSAAVISGARRLLDGRNRRRIVDAVVVQARLLTGGVTLRPST